MNATYFLISWIMLWIAILSIRYRDNFRLYWKEPIIDFPVLIFESDDWGPGSEVHADHLEEIASILLKYTDSDGRHPIMTLGVILAAPDTKKIKDSKYNTYYRRFLNDKTYAKIKNTMIKGVNIGVFDIQLHGLEHYWPSNLMAAVSQDPKVKDWLEGSTCPETEYLPTALQSRWIDSTQMPSSALNAEQIRQAIINEVAVFAETFGFKPNVVVPPTFIWDMTAEKAWQNSEIKFLVTPGRRYESRDQHGQPCSLGGSIYNGEHSSSGLIYIVRDEFFEPIQGHTAAKALTSLKRKTELGQPTLLEIHRLNFIHSETQKENALSELDQCIAGAIAAYPNLKFLSTNQLAEFYSTNILQPSIFKHIRYFFYRIWEHDTIRKWLFISGLFIPLYGIKLLNKL